MNEGHGMNVGVDTKVAFLAQASSYPESTSAVRVIETHMSWVFVTDELVYKMKKPVLLPYLDFSTLSARKHFCEESLRLNRRLAPEVYLGIVAVTREQDGKLRLGGNGEPVEWLEKMRRLPEEAMLNVAIAAGGATEEDVRRFTRTLVQFYIQALPVEISAGQYRERLRRDIRDNNLALCDREYEFNGRRVERIVGAQLGLLDQDPRMFDLRVEAGKVIEAHGDLRPEHVCLLPQPVFIDCLEFNRDFRVMDVADELSYLAMECEFAGGAFIGPAIFATYEQQTGDRIPEWLVYFYKSYRALLRAKLAAWHTRDRAPAEHPKWLRRAGAYIDLAERYAKLIDRP
jgi:aminoglycoside phosphotransferase family enzyme